MNVLAISGSLRATSSNAAIVRAAARLAPPGVLIDAYEGVAALPHFSPDLDVAPVPPAVEALRAAVGRCDALMITTPEYAHGMPGSLKNALDWLVSATEPIDKAVLLISASPSGAAHAHAQLTEVLRTMSMR
ncbi:MAG TPA: NADPH-dependent FMN reductase, partial [Kofleriaceae bacterium]